MTNENLYISSFPQGKQIGHGLGGFLASLFRRALPFIKSGAKYMGKKSLETGTKVLHEMIEGTDPKSSFKKHFNKMKEDIVHDVKRKMKGQGRRKTKKRKKRACSKKKNTNQNKT